MEFSILYSITRTDFLDSFFLTLTSIVGSYGQLFLIAGILLTVFKKTRKTGMALLLLYFGVLIFGQLIFKNLFSRPRPCQIDQTFALLIARPTSSSFPSTHSAWAFGAATVIFMNYRKAGIAAFILAGIIAFSRLYLFMHFPTDVLFGIILGIILGIAAVKLSNRFNSAPAAKTPRT